MKRISQAIVLLAAILLAQGVLASGSWTPPPPWTPPAQETPWGDPLVPGKNAPPPPAPWQRMALVESAARKLSEHFGGEFPVVFPNPADPFSFTLMVNGDTGSFQAYVRTLETLNPMAPWKGWYTQLQGYGWAKGEGFSFWGVDVPGEELQLSVSKWGQPTFYPAPMWGPPPQF